MGSPLYLRRHVFLRSDDPGPTVFPPHSWRRLVATTTITEEYEDSDTNQQQKALDAFKPLTSNKAHGAPTDHVVAALPNTVRDARTTSDARTAHATAAAFFMPQSLDLSCIGRQQPRPTLSTEHGEDAISALHDDITPFHSSALGDEFMQPPALEDVPMKRKTPSNDHAAAADDVFVPPKKKKNPYVSEDNPHGFHPTHFARLQAMPAEKRAKTIEKWLKTRESCRRYYYIRKAREEGRGNGDL